MRVQAVVEIMPRSVVLVAVLLDEDELATDDDEFDTVTEELELLVATDELLFTLELDTVTEELDFTLELDTATDELDFTLELDTATDELDFTLELAALLDDDMPVPDVGIEHSFALLLGIGSERKVATLQLKLPFNTL